MITLTSNIKITKDSGKKTSITTKTELIKMMETECLLKLPNKPKSFILVSFKKTIMTVEWTEKTGAITKEMEITTTDNMEATIDNKTTIITVAATTKTKTTKWLDNGTTITNLNHTTLIISRMIWHHLIQIQMTMKLFTLTTISSRWCLTKCNRFTLSQIQMLLVSILDKFIMVINNKMSISKIRELMLMEKCPTVSSTLWIIRTTMGLLGRISSIKTTLNKTTTPKC